MHISHQYKYIFAHVWKTGGTSIERALKHASDEAPQGGLFGTKPQSSDFGKHVGFRSLKRVLKPKYFNNYYKFAFVRNPLSWQVSFYHFIVQHPNDHPHAEHIRGLTNFEAYIHWAAEHEMHLHKQSEFVFDENGNQLADFIGRFEQLESDFALVSKELNIENVELPLINTSSHKDYRSYYNSETEELVRNCLREDFELLHY